jgi:magnesium chelatase family protein
MNGLEVIPPPLLGLGIVDSGCLMGLDLRPITVEVMSRRGPAHFQMAGLAEAAVREARVRVGSALAGLGITLDEFALTVSLAPADLRKSGSGLDLAIALAVLIAVGRVRSGPAPRTLVLGELSLDGTIRPIPGVMPMLDGAARAGYLGAIVPAANAREASYVNLDVRPLRSLDELVRYLSQSSDLPLVERGQFPSDRAFSTDLADVRGQAVPKRALEVAAAGTHNLLLTGPPGSGKSMLARRLPELLPPLSRDEALVTTSVHSVSGLVNPALGVILSPPFRAPHHSVSDAGLIGGGTFIRPGEVSLAHNGVLFLDELPEFRRSALEALRQPLEDGVVMLARAQCRVTFPARPLLIAAMNPCPCGHYGNAKTACRCSDAERLRYWARLSGPLLDRIDLKVHVPALDAGDLLQSEPSDGGVTSASVRARVKRARQMQAERQRNGETRQARNSLLDGDDLKRVAAPSHEGTRLLGLAVERLGLSARGYIRALRVARTLADLEGRTAVLETHIAESIAYRSLDSSSANTGQHRDRNVRT